MRRIALVLALALAGGIATGAPAQTVADDVRCLFLSNAFATAAKDEPARRVSTLTRAFYLGRLNGRATQAALAAAIKAQGAGVTAAQAPAAMGACAKRAEVAERQMAAVAQRARPAARAGARAGQPRK